MSNSNRQYNNTGEKGGGRGDWKAQAAAAVPRKAMKTNGFLLFTMTRKRQMGSSEASRSMSTEMAIKMFDNEWKAMSEDEKTVWKERAKAMNVRAKEETIIRIGKGGGNNNDDFARDVTPVAVAPERQVINDYDEEDEDNWDEDPRGSPVLIAAGTERNERKYNEVKKGIRTEENTHRRSVGPAPNIAVLDPEKLAAEKRRLELMDYVERLNVFNPSLSTAKFIILQFNDYYLTDLCTSVPGEIGFVVTSIRDGIVEEYSKLIDPRLESLRNSYDTLTAEAELGLPAPFFEQHHRRYPDLKSCSATDYKQVLDSLFLTLRTVAGKMETLVCFAVQSNIPRIETCIKWLINQTGQGTFDVKLYPLEEFMFVLHEMSPKKQGQFTTHRLKSSNSPYRLMDELACVWHQKREFVGLVEKCALHQVKDQAYHFMQGLIKDYGVQLIDGVHIPIRDVKCSIEVMGADDFMANTDFAMNEEFSKSYSEENQKRQARNNQRGSGVEVAAYSVECLETGWSSVHGANSGQQNPPRNSFDMNVELAATARNLRLVKSLQNLSLG